MCMIYICLNTLFSIIAILGVVDWAFITWLSSIYILGNLILSHTHFPLVEQGKKLHWVEYAYLYTTNVRSSWWVDWWMVSFSFLNVLSTDFLCNVLIISNCTNYMTFMMV